MAFPIVESTATTGRTAAETTSPVTFPATISPNALIVCIARSAVVGAIGWPAGWVELVEDSSDASDDVTAIAYFTAVGNEDGTTFDVTHGSGKSAYIVYSITGAAAPGNQAPQLSTVAVGTSATPDPTSLSPTGGAKDYLWLWFGGWEGEQTSPPAGNPTNYTNPLGANTGIAGVITTNCRVASARRNLNAASEDPPSWTISVSDDWSAWVMAVHPAPLQVTLAAAPAGVATVTAALAAQRPLAATIVGLATVAGAVKLDRGLATSSAGKSTPAAALTVTAAGVTLAAAPAGRATVAAAISITRGLSTAPAGVATVSGAMAVARPLAAAPKGVTTVVAALANSLLLKAQSRGTSTPTVSLNVLVRLAAISAGKAKLEARMSVERYFVTWEALQSILNAKNSPFKYDGEGFFFDTKKHQ